MEMSSSIQKAVVFNRPAKRLRFLWNAIERYHGHTIFYTSWIKVAKKHATDTRPALELQAPGSQENEWMGFGHPTFRRYIQSFNKCSCIVYDGFFSKVPL